MMYFPYGIITLCDLPYKTNDVITLVSYLSLEMTNYFLTSKHILVGKMLVKGKASEVDTWHGFIAL